jgi:putative membrane protein insertion efficiency factor
MKILFYKAVRFYKKRVSPGLSTGCVYTPTCSQYSMTAFYEHGTVKGLFLTFYRILRCNRFSRGGYDPVPVNKKKYKWII